jgi:hypothetical protein
MVVLALLWQKLFAPLFFRDLFSAVRTPLRRRPKDDIDYGVTYGGHGWLRWRSLDSFSPPRVCEATMLHVGNYCHQGVAMKTLCQRRSKIDSAGGSKNNHLSQTKSGRCRRIGSLHPGDLIGPRAAWPLTLRSCPKCLASLAAAVGRAQSAEKPIRNFAIGTQERRPGNAGRCISSARAAL